MHTRLRPEIILIAKNKHIKVSSFKNAQFFDDPEKNVFDANSINLLPDENHGLHYMAPEFIEEPNITSPAMDLWALGCIIYQMVKGKKPFDANKPHRIVQNIIDCNLMYDKQDNERLSDECKDIINKLLNL